MKRVHVAIIKTIFVLSYLLIGCGFVFCNSPMHPTSQLDYVKREIERKSEPIYSAFIALSTKADFHINNYKHHAVRQYSVPGLTGEQQNDSLSSVTGRYIQDDGFWAYCYALMYELTDNDKYGQKAIFYLDSWANINKTFANDNARLAIPAGGAGLMNAALLMNDKEIWNNRSKRKFHKWAKNVYRKTCYSTIHFDNNCTDWDYYGLLLLASLSNDEKEIKKISSIVQARMETSIGENGRMEKEYMRGTIKGDDFDVSPGINGLWYSYFSLAPITASAWIIYNQTGENLFEWEGKNGASIKKAIDFLYYYYINYEDWIHPKPSRGFSEEGVNYMWPENLFEAMTGIYKEIDYYNYLEKWRPIMYCSHNFAWTFPSLMPIKIGIYEK